MSVQDAAPTDSVSDVGAIPPVSPPDAPEDHLDVPSKETVTLDAEVANKLVNKITALEKRLKSYEERENINQFKTMRESKLQVLQELDPVMAEKLKSESDLNKLDVAIEVVKVHNESFDKRFPEFQRVKKGKDPIPSSISGFDPFTGEIK